MPLETPEKHSLDVSKSALSGESPIFGTWKLRSLLFEATATGQRSSPFGDHPIGYLSYSANGRMYAIGVVEDRPKPRDSLPTDQEKVKLQESMFAYAGTYAADGEKVVHHVDISWNESWTGTDLVRIYKLDGGRRVRSSVEQNAVGNIKTKQVYGATLARPARNDSS